MRSATFTLLAATLVSVCSAAPAALAASGLPAKFSLSYVPLQNSPLPAAGNTIVADKNYDLYLTANQPSTRAKELVIFNSNSTSAYSAAFVDHTHLGWLPGFEWRADWFVSLGQQGVGGSVILSFPDTLESPVVSTGLGVVNGGLTWDLGEGPKSLWGMCLLRGEYSLVWGQTGTGCVAVDVKVHAL